MPKTSEQESKRDWNESNLAAVKENVDTISGNVFSMFAICWQDVPVSSLDHLGGFLRCHLQAIDQ